MKPINSAATAAELLPAGQPGQHANTDPSNLSQESHSWTATVLLADAVGQSVEWDINEAWKWCLSRIAAMGKLEIGHARLIALMNWSPARINEARDQAWDCLRKLHCSREERQATWEYLSGECLACMALDLPWEHSAAVREPVQLTII